MTTIYLSSTYEDLKEYRAAVFEALRKAGYEVLAMEDYLATDRRPVDKCLADVAQADIYVGLFAFRYGYVPPAKHGNPDGLSITELELRQAEKLGKPCLAFVVSEDAPWAPKFIDGLKGERINRLREYLLTEKTASFFSSPHQLASLVQAAVTKHLSEKSKLAKPESKLKPGTVFRDTLKDGSQGPQMVEIPAGTFQMGDIVGDGIECERPVHTVRITKPFAIGRFEVTFDEYDQFAAARGRELPGDKGWGRGRLPVINVSWNDATDYAEWLSQQTAKRYRLPTEAEWEYAARAGTETAYWWGNEVKPGLATTRWDGKRTSPVGTFQPNRFGLYDTAGNVWEWLEDCWHENYNGAPADGSPWKEVGGGDCGQRVIRGGSWSSIPDLLRSSFRYGGGADGRYGDIGFRLAQDID
jgi:formylglycine-generating enzyme required for sulfatase activity